ncbi:polyisoprenoid-binding protein [Mesorhizobium plurifarium]|uniref:YceI family protein n=1 Tax=Sinorhizobium arboris TaxID=76745 RepID=UPI0003F5E187|nr:YceI family protein [Sinorhizobium arboris]PST24590.1 polyisoprenoid-binding protein [Mesorhizobium plurifarium]
MTLARKQSTAATLPLALLTLALSWAPVAGAKAPALTDAAGNYRIASSSSIRFSVGQVGGSGGIAGSFAKFAGNFRIDGADIARSSVEFTLYPESVRSTERRIEDFLRSSAVFDAANHKTVTFRSTGVSQTGPDTATIEGVLTARGKSRKERFAVRLTDWDSRSISFTIRGSIRRSPYGMTVGTPIYSNVVEFDMNITGQKR